MLEIFIDELMKLGVGASLDVEGYRANSPATTVHGKLIPVAGLGEVQHPEKPTERFKFKTSLNQNVKSSPWFGGLNVR
jgi:hypothetical protein